MEVTFKRHITGFLSSSVTFNESHHMSKKKNKQKQTVILYNFFLHNLSRVTFQRLVSSQITLLKIVTQWFAQKRK